MMLREMFISSNEGNCHDINNVTNQCEYLNQCFQDIGMINYLKIYYCANNYNISLGLIGFGLIISFISIGKVASEYLLPNLQTISKFLKLSDNLAGLTLLAMGNCSPDILSTYKAMSIGEPNLALSELIGSSFLITTVVIGMISIIHPFKLPSKVFLRDGGFLWMILLFIFIIFCYGYISFTSSCLLIIFYIIYVVYIVINHNILRSKVIKNLRDERIRNHYSLHAQTNPNNRGDSDEEMNMDLIDLPAIDEINLNSINEYDEDFQRELVSEYDEFRRFNSDDININANSYGVKQLIKELTKHNNHRIELTHERPLFDHSPIQLIDNELIADNNNNPVDEDETDDDDYDIDNDYYNDSSAGMSLKFLCSNYWWVLLEFNHFKNLSWIEKVAFILTYPINLLIKLTTPLDSNFQLPQLIICSIYVNSLTFINWKFLIFINIPISIMAIVLMIKYPYEILYSIIGFIISITWISFFANEIINSLKSISIIYQLSDEILGFTIFAIGNSIGDIIANFTIARMGMPIMAFAACFGSPILSLTSLGLNTLIVLFNNENYSKHYISDFGYLINVNHSLIVLNLGGLINLLILIIMVKLNNWFIDVKIGCVLLFNWGVITLICVLLELNEL